MRHHDLFACLKGVPICTHELKDSSSVIVTVFDAACAIQQVVKPVLNLAAGLSGKNNLNTANPQQLLGTCMDGI